MHLMLELHNNPRREAFTSNTIRLSFQVNLLNTKQLPIFTVIRTQILKNYLKLRMI